MDRGPLFLFGCRVQPPFAVHCERLKTVAPDDTDRLGQVLGWLVGWG